MTLSKRAFLEKDYTLNNCEVLKVKFNVKMLPEPKQCKWVFVFVFFFFKHVPFIPGKQGYWLNEILFAIENMVLNHQMISMFTLYCKGFER